MIRGRKYALAAAGLIVIGAIVVLVGRGGSPAVPQLRPDDPEAVARGAALYARHCASCHGARLQGQPNWRTRRADGKLPAPPHDATGHTWHHPDAMLFALTKRGPAALARPGYATDMPGYADALSDEEIIAVLSYIKSRWPADIRARHDRINERSKQGGSG